MTTIGMTILIAGVLAFAVGWGSQKNKGSLLGMGALMMLGGMFIGIGGNPARDMPNGSPGMVMIGFILAGIGIFMLVRQLGQSRKDFQNMVVKAEDDKLIGFYEECVKNGVTQCVTEREIQKATLIAQKRNLKFSDITALYIDAKVAVDKRKQNDKNAKLNEKKKKERAECAKLERFSTFKGRDKRIAMLSEEREEELKSAKTLRDGAMAVMNATQQKEHDWAVHGGIASGIAGPAAGVATAMDIQAKNAQIRAQNEANRKAFAPIMMTSYEGAAQHDRRAAALLEEIESAKTKLVSNDDAKTCLSKLSFFGTMVLVSETGTCTVTTNVKLAEPFFIFGDVEAVVDGTVIAKIYDGDTMVGVASLVLPTYGVKSATKLKGMCLYCGTPGKKYTVEFAAANLWAMER